MRVKKRSVLYIKGTEGCAYDEAYFIIKDENETSLRAENVTRDMVYEANRIIEENFEFKKRNKKIPRFAILSSFIAGVIITQILNIIF